MEPIRCTKCGETIFNLSYETKTLNLVCNSCGTPSKITMAHPILDGLVRADGKSFARTD